MAEPPPRVWRALLSHALVALAYVLAAVAAVFVATMARTRREPGPAHDAMAAQAVVSRGVQSRITRGRAWSDRQRLRETRPRTIVRARCLRPHPLRLDPLTVGLADRAVPGLAHGARGQRPAGDRRAQDRREPRASDLESADMAMGRPSRGPSAATPPGFGGDGSLGRRGSRAGRAKRSEQKIVSAWSIPSCRQPAPPLDSPGESSHRGGGGLQPEQLHARDDERGARAPRRSLGVGAYRVDRRRFRAAPRRL